jgi:hypothetical protein
MATKSVREYTCPKCKAAWKPSTTLLGTPLLGKHAGTCLQMRIRNNIVLVGFGHKLKKKIAPSSWAEKLQDGVIYAYARRFGFVKLPARCLKHVHRVLGPRFVLVDQGILIASTEVLIPKLQESLAGVSIGLDRNGDDEIVWVTCSREGKKRLKAALPSYDAVPDEAA